MQQYLQEGQGFAQDLPDPREYSLSEIAGFSQTLPAKLPAEFRLSEAEVLKPRKYHVLYRVFWMQYSQ